MLRAAYRQWTMVIRENGVYTSYPCLVKGGGLVPSAAPDSPEVAELFSRVEQFYFARSLKVREMWSGTRLTAVALVVAVALGLERC